MSGARVSAEVKAKEIQDYPGGYPAWHAAISAASTRQANARPLSPVAKTATTPAKPTQVKLSEHEEQALVIARAEALAPSVPEMRMLFAIPNGGVRSKATAGKLKVEGVKSGVSDLFLSVARGGYHGLYVEMKAHGSRGASDAQKDWIAAAKSEGYRAEVCVGADAAWVVICEYLGIISDEHRG
ncbi:MAG: VRR-NUC domain-containing protein [Desulfovibrio sp.]